MPMQNFHVINESIMAARLYCNKCEHKPSNIFAQHMTNDKGDVVDVIFVCAFCLNVERVSKEEYDKVMSTLKVQQ